MSKDVLFVVEKCSHCASYYDVATGERLASIELPDFPHEVVFDALNNFAYIAHYGLRASDDVGQGGHSVIVVDVKKKAIARVVDLSPFNRLHGIALDQYDRLSVLSEEKGVLLSFDKLAEIKSPDYAVHTGGIKCHLFALSRDGEFAYSMNLLSNTVTKIKPRDSMFTPVAVSPGEKPEGCCLINDDQQLLVTNREGNTIALIDTHTMTVLKTVASRKNPARIYQSQDKRLLVANYGSNNISIVDVTTLEEECCIDVGAKPLAISFHPAGGEAYISQDDNRIGILDLKSMKIERHIETLLEPDVSNLLVS